MHVTRNLAICAAAPLPVVISAAQQLHVNLALDSSWYRPYVQRGYIQVCVRKQPLEPAAAIAGNIRGRHAYDKYCWSCLVPERTTSPGHHRRRCLRLPRGSPESGALHILGYILPILVRKSAATHTTAFANGNYCITTTFYCSRDTTNLLKLQRLRMWRMLELRGLLGRGGYGAFAGSLPCLKV